MKTTIEILDEICNSKFTIDFNESLLNVNEHESGNYIYSGNFEDVIKEAMISFAKQAIIKDRENIAENVKISKFVYMEPDGIVFSVDKDSIINAPKQELK